MVKDLDMGIEIIGVPTVRESDGLAMSSRNSYLNPEERSSALSLKKSIEMAKDMVRRGEKDATGVISAIKTLISSHPFTKIDYISVCDPITMEDKSVIEGECLLALAVKIGKTRLIDNCLIDIG
jgi:pantoate--beta-alanine ligase